MCCYHHSFVTACHFHNRRKYFLYIRHPQIQCARSQYHFGADGIRKRNDAFIPVHRRESRTADPVKPDPLCPFFSGFLLEFFAESHGNNLPHKYRQMSMYCNIDIAFFQSTDICLRRGTIPYAQQGICCNGCGHHSGKAECKTAPQELEHYASPVAVCGNA